MKGLTIMLLLSLTLTVFAQEDDKYQEWISKRPLKDNIFFDPATDYNDKEDLYAVSRFVLDSLKILDRSADPLDDARCAIIIVHNDFTHSGSRVVHDLTKANSILLHKERKPGRLKKEWSEYMYQTRNIYIIFLGNTGLNNEGKPLNLKLNITNGESFFHTSFKELVKVLKTGIESGDEGKISVRNDQGIRCRVIKLSKVKVNPPTDFDFTVPIQKQEEVQDKGDPTTVDFIGATEPKTKLTFTVPGTPKTKTVYNDDSKKFSYKIHERNNLAFSIGMVGTKLTYRDFVLDSVRNIAIAELDSTKKAEWKSNLNVNLEFYPFGRDIDQLEPFFKKPWHKLHTRFGIIGGVKLSKDPLSAVNLGLAFSYSKMVTVTWGWSWVDNRILDQTVKVAADVRTIDQAKDYFKRDYERSKMTVGISFAPGQIAKALGIGEKKGEKLKEN
jgi:hypothetical protein